ncbi:MAG: glycosyltransferase family 2 protein [Micromonosporaceae bacterium]|nr:glycosyltransferase family 2 protein [Micromonosporaceae bacterium]
MTVDALAEAGRVTPRPLDRGDAEAFCAPRTLDVLIPTRNRPAELAATLSGLAGQPESFGVVICDQSDDGPSWRHPAVAGLVRVLRRQDRPVLLCERPERLGLAENRAHLLASSQARYVLFVDDDIWLEPGSVGRMLDAIQTLGCGMVGSFPHGLSYLDDHRPEQESPYEEWAGPPEPERIWPRGPQWNRSLVHAAANLLHVTDRLGLGPDEWRAYKVAWIGACVMFDRRRLLDSGGYDFWPEVPSDHVGEDVLVQLRVLDRYGGAGIVPSGAYHLESPTTVPHRAVECYDVVPVHEPQRLPG